MRLRAINEKRPHIRKLALIAKRPTMFRRAESRWTWKASAFWRASCPWASCGRHDGHRGSGNRSCSQLCRSGRSRRTGNGRRWITRAARPRWNLSFGNDGFRGCRTTAEAENRTFTVCKLMQLLALIQSPIVRDRQVNSYRSTYTHRSPYFESTTPTFYPFAHAD